MIDERLTHILTFLSKLTYGQISVQASIDNSITFQVSSSAAEAMRKVRDRSVPTDELKSFPSSGLSSMCERVIEYDI